VGGSKEGGGKEGDASGDDLHGISVRCDRFHRWLEKRVQGGLTRRAGKGPLCTAGKRGEKRVGRKKSRTEKQENVEETAVRVWRGGRSFGNEWIVGLGGTVGGLRNNQREL